MMQLDMFKDKRMKILYALSFMHRGIAPWPARRSD